MNDVQAWLLALNGLAMLVVSGSLVFLLQNNSEINRRLGELIATVSTMLKSHDEKVASVLQAEERARKELARRIDLHDRLASAYTDADFTSVAYGEGQVETIPATSKIRKLLHASN